MTTTIPTSDVVDPAALPPDARTLHLHLQGTAFSHGVDAGWWREVRWRFPHVDIEVAAAPRAGAPAWFLFRFECTGYPHQAPLCLLWDHAKDEPADVGMRPIGTERVGMVFRTNWEGRYLYSPLDRHALATHPDWSSRYRSAWKASFTIATYLTDLHDLLNSRAYTGIPGTPAPDSLPP